MIDKMANKKEIIKKEQKNFIIGIILIISIIFLITLSVMAQGEGNESLQGELNNLTSELSSQGYDWLINYSVDESVDIEVYRENDGEEIVRFVDISSEDWYKIYLTELGENESYDVFDLNNLKEVKDERSRD